MNRFILYWKLAWPYRLRAALHSILRYLGINTYKMALQDLDDLWTLTKIEIGIDLADVMKEWR